MKTFRFGLKDGKSFLPIFFMLALIVYYIKYFIVVLAAPFYFHFGHCALLGELIEFLFDVTDVLALYYVQFILLLVLVLYRNLAFKTLNAFILRSHYLNQIRTAFLAFFQYFWLNVKNLFKRFK